MAHPVRIAVVYTSQSMPAHQSRLKTFAHAMGEGTKKFASGVWQDFKTTNRSSAKTVLTIGVANPLMGSYVTNLYQTRMPLGWLLNRFGPLPCEFAGNGAIRVFELPVGGVYEFSFAERALLVAKGALVRFALVTVALRRAPKTRSAERSLISAAPLGTRS